MFDIYWSTLCDVPGECCSNCPAQSTHRQIDCIIEGKTMEWIQRVEEEMGWMGGGVAYKNRACQQTEVPYERYILMPACLRVCVSASRLIYGPSCWSVLCIFPQESGRERGRDGKWGRQRERGHCQAFCHVVYFVYKRVPLTYFVPHNERSWWPLINYITHKSALHTHTNTQTHTHTHHRVHSHTRLNKLAAHPRNLICMAFQFVLCCFLLSTFSSSSFFLLFLCWFSFSFYFLHSDPFFVHCSLLVPCLLVLHLPLYKFLVFAPISFQIERWPQSFIFNAPGNEKQRSNMPQLVASRRDCRRRSRRKSRGQSRL